MPRGSAWTAELAALALLKAGAKISPSRRLVEFDDGEVVTFEFVDAHPHETGEFALDRIHEMAYAKR